MSGDIPSHSLDAANSPPPAELVAVARQRLELHPHFHHPCHPIEVAWRGEGLLLTGQLPSYHLKQLAQEALRGLCLIDNQIEVVESSENAGGQIVPGD